MPVRESQTTGNENPILSDDPIEDAWTFAVNSRTDTDYVKEFMLTTGQTAKAVILSKAPYVFKSHTVKTRTKNGKDRYITVPCQKMTQQTCVMCESNHEAIGEMKNSIVFEVLDSRGNYKEGNFDGKPTVKAFIVPQYLAAALNTLRASCGGDLTQYVVKMEKVKNYSVSIDIKDKGDGSFVYVKAPDISKFADERIDLKTAYAPMDDTELREFLKKRLNGGAATSAPKGNDVGGFGGDDDDSDANSPFA